LNWNITTAWMFRAGISLLTEYFVLQYPCWLKLLSWNILAVFCGWPRCHIDTCFWYPNHSVVFGILRASYISIWRFSREGLRYQTKKCCSAVNSINVKLTRPSWLWETTQDATHHKRVQLTGRQHRTRHTPDTETRPQKASYWKMTFFWYSKNDVFVWIQTASVSMTARVHRQKQTILKMSRFWCSRTTLFMTHTQSRLLLSN
jgi:hypothetical protein